MSVLRRTHALFIATLVFGASSAGCSLLVDPPVDTLENVCASDSDCPGDRCDTEHGLCVSTTTPAYALRIEVTPASDPLGGTPVPVTFDVSSVDAARELVVPSSVPVQGTVRYDETIAVAAQITFTRSSASGTSETSGLAGSVAARATSTTGGPVDFSTRLPGGATYDVYVEPLDVWRERLPPLHAQLEVPEGTGVSVPIAYASEGLTTLRGVVRDVDGDPQVGLRAAAVDAYGNVVSSTSSTGDDGSFALVVPVGLRSFALRIRGDSTRQDTAALFPQIVVDTSALMLGPEGEFIVLVPSSDDALWFVGTVELPATLGTNVPAEGAQVHLESDAVSDPETGIRGSLTLDLTAGSDGRFQGWVLPGTYTIEATGTNEAAGVLVGTVDVVSSPTGMLLGQVFTLPERAVLGGTVQLVDGTAIQGATVQASALGLALDEGPLGAALLNRTSSGRTGSLGEFRLPLDVGMYDLAVELDASSGFGWYVERRYRVDESARALRATISVAAPYRHEGVLTYGDGTPVAEATVRFYAVDPSSGRATAIGEASTDETGVFVGLLPAAID